MSSAEEKSVPLEGTQPIKPEETDVDLVPKPEVENGQLKCPICHATVASMAQYFQHVHDEHRLGTSTSTAIY